MSRKRRGRGEGTVYRRPNGTWCGALTTGWTEEGKQQRVYVYGRDKAEVLEKLDRLTHDKVDGMLVQPSREKVGPFLRRWLEHVAKPAVRPSTYRLYEGIARLHLIPKIGGLSVTRLTPANVQHLLADLSKEEQHPRTQQMIVGVLRRALNAAVRQGIVPRNVTDAVTKPRVPKPEMQTWTPEQVGTFLKVARQDRPYALYVLALTTGMRRGELFGLQWQDLDLDAGSLSLKRQLTDNNGHPATVELKTKTSQRKVDLSPQVAVAALRAHRKRMFKEGHVRPEGLVFVDSEGNPLRPSNFLRRDFFPLVKRAQVPRIRFHDLRHTAATLMLQQGVNPKVVAERLGHSTIRLTMDLYGHAWPSMQQEAAEKIDALVTRVIASAKVPKPAGPKVIGLPDR